MSVIEVNVGGEVYSTTRSTMTRYPESMLGKMFSGQIETTKDKIGRIFIDRDGKLFRHVLNFLRTATLDLPNDFNDYDNLYNEANYYQLKPLIDSLRNQQQQKGGTLSNDVDLSVITMNVGGECYSTYLSTMITYPDSVLGKMFTGLTPIVRDKHGRVFIDRDGKIFRYVLNFLRNSDLVLPSNFNEYKALCTEAEFYQIKPLKKALQRWNKQQGEDVLRYNNKHMFVFVIDVTDSGNCMLTGNSEVLKAVFKGSVLRAIKEQERYCLQLGLDIEHCLVQVPHSDIGSRCFTARSLWNSITGYLLGAGCSLISSTTSFGNYVLGTDTYEPIKLNSHDVWWCDLSQLKLMKEISSGVKAKVDSQVKATVASPDAKQVSIVELNIGGELYSTSLSTIKRYQGSVLEKMFNGKIPIAKDKEDRVFIDRDGKVFRHILNFLRTSTLLLPVDFKEFDGLCIEAKFFKIQPLTESLQDSKRNNDFVKLSERERMFVFVVGIENSNFCYLFGKTAVLERIPSRYFVDKIGDILGDVEYVWENNRKENPAEMIFAIKGNNTNPPVKTISDTCSPRAWRDHLTQYLLHAGCSLVSSTTNYGNYSRREDRELDSGRETVRFNARDVWWCDVELLKMHFNSVCPDEAVQINKLRLKKARLFKMRFPSCRCS